MRGWIKLHRKTLDSPIFDNPNLFKMWMWCLLKASHTEYKALVGLEEIELKEGQFITGRTKGSAELNVNPSTWYKHLKALESMSMISLESNNKMTVVTVENWAIYQGNGLEKEQQKNNEITTKEQQSNTYKNVKNVKNDKKETYAIVIDYLNSRTGKNFRSNTKTTTKLIDARLNEGFTVEDFKAVVDVKSKEWKHDKDMARFLRPQTLFGTKFESYLNENADNRKAPTETFVPKFVYREL